jgi:hypothetical protein
LIGKNKFPAGLTEKETGKPGKRGEVFYSTKRKKPEK